MGGLGPRNHKGHKATSGFDSMFAALAGVGFRGVHVRSWPAAYSVQFTSVGPQ